MPSIAESIPQPASTPSDLIHPASMSNTLSSPPLETDVAIIGNGPSAICLSYFLSGYWPFYNGTLHPDEILQWHLTEIDPSLSLVEQDLSFLSEGLEGRSSNPVAVLFDALTQPNADLGDRRPSCIDFKCDPLKSIPHAVLGRGAPGGSWNLIESNLLTVSTGSWMELPGIDFQTWRDPSNKAADSETRVKVGEVAAYYLDYVRNNGLEKYFHSHTEVTSAKKVNPCSELVDSETGEEEICAKCATYHSQKTHWEVRCTRRNYLGNGNWNEEETITKAKYVVLATGAHDNPRKLLVEGEDDFPYVMHTFRELEDAIMGGSLSTSKSGKNKKKTQKKLCEGDVAGNSSEESKESPLCKASLPLVIVGAGLTAADAITIARSKGIPVIHVFRCKCNNSSLIFHKLPPALFPEYHNIFALMNGKQDPEHGGCQQCYTAFQGYTVSKFLDGGEVVLCDKETNLETVIKCGGALICAGARPCLDFLEQEGRHLGLSESMKPIDSASNPVEIDVFSYESVKEKNLFAMGPLVGDNFVRFLRGGALGITNHLWKSKTRLDDHQTSRLDS